MVEFISGEQAINHLRTSLDDEVAAGCGNDHAKVGFSGAING